VDAVPAINYCLPKLSGRAVSRRLRGGILQFSRVICQNVKATRHTEKKS
jgi:hypothetical protein